MKCQRCGAQHDSEFCPYCGQKRQKSNSAIIAVVVIAALFFAAAFLGYRFFQNRAGQNTLESNGIKITVTEVMTSNGDLLYQPENGNEFLYLKLTIQNESESRVFLMLPHISASFDGAAVPESHAAEWAAESWRSFTGEINPGEQTSGMLAYEVPRNWKKANIVFRVPEVDAKMTYRMENTD